jgi:hypothetical protein
MLAWRLPFRPTGERPDSNSNSTCTALPGQGAMSPLLALIPLHVPFPLTCPSLNAQLGIATRYQIGGPLPSRREPSLSSREGRLVGRAGSGHGRQPGHGRRLARGPSRRKPTRRHLSRREPNWSSLESSPVGRAGSGHDQRPPARGARRSGPCTEQHVLL